jgi:hypothetical protein
MLNEAHTPQRDLRIRDLLVTMRHDGCGGRAGRVELLTGIGCAASSACHTRSRRRKRRTPYDLCSIILATFRIGP